ncbi:hypothetical protein BCV71DRAFT_159217, partial [Rhizopus microsporus]
GDKNALIPECTNFYRQMKVPSYNGIRCILILKGEHSESLMKYTFNNTLLSSV